MLLELKKLRDLRETYCILYNDFECYRHKSGADPPLQVIINKFYASLIFLFLEIFPQNISTKMQCFFQMFSLKAEGEITMRCFILFLLATNLGFGVGENAKPKKIAILGGGAASCSAALALTGQPGWKEHYNITIYQLGWRLGGKARSGRNKDYAQRVEEITGHDITAVSFNLVRVLRSVYEELNRTEGAPLRTFEEAFILHSSIGNTHPDLDSQTDRECFSLNYLFKKLRETFLKITRKMMKEMKIEQTGTME